MNRKSITDSYWNKYGKGQYKRADDDSAEAMSEEERRRREFENVPQSDFDWDKAFEQIPEPDYYETDPKDRFIQEIERTGYKKGSEDNIWRKLETGGVTEVQLVSEGIGILRAVSLDELKIKVDSRAIQTAEEVAMDANVDQIMSTLQEITFVIFRVLVPYENAETASTSLSAVKSAASKFIEKMSKEEDRGY